MSDISPKTIKGYVLTDLIGLGGFGAVYRAYQPIIDREVAIKAILPEYANHPDFIRRFETEAQIVARLEHPHIVPLYDYWREPDGAYLVMRLLRGGNLHDKLAADGPWPLPQAGRFVEQIAAALMIAHRKGIIHQDLKPGNVLLDEDLNCYLADFGIARNLLEHQAGSGENPRIGTPLFMAPEQFRPEVIITPQTDIYSLGIVIYTVLTGRVPFTDTRTTTVIRSHLTEPLPPLQFVRPDLPHEINAVLRQATAKEPEARYATVALLAQDFRRCIPGMEYYPELEFARVADLQADLPTNSITVILDSGGGDIQNPYKGLQAFQEADAADFYGREALIKRLLNRLKAPGLAGRFLAVIGPSGSGKSSVVLAGVVPLLRQGYVPGSARWYIVRMQPGADPFAKLETALTSIALDRPDDLAATLRADEHGLSRAMAEVLPDPTSDLLLVIDQFEEVFTLMSNESERARFLATLVNAVTAPESRLRVILTLRADFYDRPLLYPLFGELVREHTEVVLPLSEQELTQAILFPAERNGLQVEAALVSALVRDVVAQPGTLPLLQYTLSDLFGRRQDTTLTFDAYLAAGGISGTLARRADELYSDLPPSRQRLARQIFLRLVAVSEGAEATRQRVTWAALLSLSSGDADRGEIRAVLEVFGRNRLLTFDHDPETREPTVEVAHEALIREWDLLQSWLEENRADLLTQRRLGGAITDWKNARRDPSYLATGSRLAQFEAWQTTTSLTLTEDEAAYLRASVALRRRAQTRLRLFIAALIGTVLIALGLARFAFDQQAATARQAEISRSRALAATALTNLNGLDRSLLLSLEALNSADTFEARNSLLTGLQSAPALQVFMHGHTDWVRTVAFSPDGRLIASAGRDMTIRLWDTATKEPVGAPLTGHTGWVNSVAFSPDGTRLASAGQDMTIRLWDAATGAPLGEPLAEHGGEVWSVAFSPDGTRLASAGADGVLLWTLAGETPTPLRLEGHTDTVYAAAFSPDGRLLASAGADRAIRLWDAASGEPVGAPLEAHVNWVLALAFSPDSRLLASTGVSASIILWEVATGQALGEIPSAHSNWVRSIEFSPDGTQLLTASTDATVRLWDVRTGQLNATLAGHQDAAWCAVFSPDGTLIASGGQDSAVIVWQPGAPGRLSHALDVTGLSGSSLAFSPDGRWLAVASGQFLGSTEDKTVALWALDTQPPMLQVLTGHNEIVTATAFNAAGTRLATASIDHTVRVWDLTADPPADIATLQGHSSGIFGVAFSPDDRLIASGDDTGLIILWDAATGEVSGDPLTDHRATITALVFSPDGSRLASASRDGQIRVWDVAGRRQVYLLEGHETAVDGLAFSPDGRLLASGGRDNSVRLWDLATGRAARPPLTGHANWVLSAAFSPDSAILATGGRDNAIILWDVQTGRPLAAPLLQGDEGWVMALAYETVGHSLLAGSTTAITRWDALPDPWRETACRIANRDLTAEEWARYLPDLPYRATCGQAATGVATETPG